MAQDTHIVLLVVVHNTCAQNEVAALPVLDFFAQFREPSLQQTRERRGALARGDLGT